MRYVILAVATGLLVIGTAGYAAKATQKQSPANARLLFAPERTSVTQLKAAAVKGILERENAAYTAKVLQIELQREQDRKNNLAVKQFGEWGPYLIEAAARYGQDPAVLYRVMMCESKGDAHADNGVCKGLFQFDPDTWAGTPYGQESIFDGHAQILAAAWMFSQGRKGEWTCQ
jgi:soluble lytic murein transglycosylase-like protein